MFNTQRHIFFKIKEVAGVEEEERARQANQAVRATSWLTDQLLLFCQCKCRPNYKIRTGCLFVTRVGEKVYFSERYRHTVL